MHLLDTDKVIAALASDSSVRKIMANLTPMCVSISSVALMEVTHGLLLSGTDMSRNHFEQLLQEAPVISFSSREAKVCAAIRVGLQREGKRVRSRSLDLMTAATAQSHNLTLVTRNFADYRNIPGLTVITPEDRSVN